MPQQALIKTIPSQKSTCADCLLFNDYQDRGRGLCLVFDKVVRKHHQLTNDCVQQNETNRKRELSSPEALSAMSKTM